MNERKTIDADKALLHMTFAGRRLLIAHVITCIAFIIAIVFFTTQNTQREQQIIELQNKVNMLNLAASQTAQTAALVADNTAQTQYLINRIAPYPVPAYTVTNPNTPAT